MFEFDITKWVPKFILNDKNGYAVAKAIEAGIQIMNDTVAKGLECLMDYDKMPEWRLDELAWEMNCLYDFYASIEEKRRWIKNATPWYLEYGTRAAVEKTANAVFSDSFVEEWFEYGGKPYYFRVSAKGKPDESDIRRFREMLEKAKNVRSILESIGFGEECTIKERISVACTQSAGVTIRCEGQA